MLPAQWSSPCNSQCTAKYAALMQIPWRVFCKKGCDSDGETWEECINECDEICYKDPVLKDRQWSSYIDRSPGADTQSAECFHACVAGCGYKAARPNYHMYVFVKQFNIPCQTVDQVHPNRPPKQCIDKKPPSSSPAPVLVEQIATPDELPSTSA